MMREIDAKQKDAERLKAITADIDTLCQRLKFLHHESRLLAARHLAKGVNSTTKMFNCAIFIRDKDEETGADLFAEKPAAEESELFV